MIDLGTTPEFQSYARLRFINRATLAQVQRVIDRVGEGFIVVAHAGYGLRPVYTRQMPDDLRAADVFAVVIPTAPVQGEVCYLWA